MKLRNKKTGEIKNVNHSKVLIHFNDGETKCIKSLSELNEEWEDYEESKEYYFINSVGEVIRPSDTDDWEQEDAAHHKQIGNYFETREEAEKAVEKLKAWKRLNDKGLELAGWGCKTPDGTFLIMAKAESCDEVVDDLDLLFGGEE